MPEAPPQPQPKEAVKPAPETKDQPKEGAKPESPKESQGKEHASKGIFPNLKDKGKAPQGQPEKGQEPTKDELFKGVDPSKLSPENLELYNSMLSDYKRKTQELAEERKKLSSEDVKRQAVDEALSNLTTDQFNTLIQHPTFQRELVSHIKSRGLSLNGNAQDPQGSGASQIDLDSMTDNERILWENQQKVESENREMREELSKLSANSRHVSIQSQDSTLVSKYGDIYQPSMVNSFLEDISNGRRVLNREDIFRILDYENNGKRGYEWGLKETYSEAPEKERAAFLSSMKGGGAQSYEIPQRQKGESHYSYMQRVFENSKKVVAEGKQSPYLRQG